MMTLSYLIGKSMSVVQMMLTLRYLIVKLMSVVRLLVFLQRYIWRYIIVAFKFLFQKTKYYNGDVNMPIYKWTQRRHQFTIEELATIVAAKSIPPSLICTKQPSNVQQNVAFVIDLHKLDNPYNIE